ncbi:MAG: hypothetical protein HYV16_08545 [Gammaproteobacteria bacterium]|nr:hypothetical protein [Gammaproteobacteria bacterium]
MSTAEHKLLYRFRFQDGSEYQHAVCLAADSQLDISPLPEVLPEWTALDWGQCSHCPLTVEEHPHCPFAARLAPVLAAFATTQSFDTVQLDVDDGIRRLSQETTAQRAVGSLLGLVCATSGCPYGEPFRPLARFHLPLASAEETLFRVVGAHLIRQLLQHGMACEADLSDLGEIYQAIHGVNVGMAKRLRAAATTDAAVNAIVILDMLAGYVPASVESALQELRELFLPAQPA